MSSIVLEDNRDTTGKIGLAGQPGVDEDDVLLLGSGVKEITVNTPDPRAALHYLPAAILGWFIELEMPC